MKGSDTAEPTVDHEVLAADVAVLGPGEPRDQGSHLVGPAEASHGYASGNLRPFAFSEYSTGHVRLDESWRNAVGEDSIARDLGGERCGHPVEGELAGGVRGALLLAHDAEDGRDVDDPAPTLLPHARKHGTAEEKGR